MNDFAGVTLDTEASRRLVFDIRYRHRKRDAA